MTPPPPKHRRHYAPDGTRLVSLETMRRRRRLLQTTRTESLPKADDEICEDGMMCPNVQNISAPIPLAFPAEAALDEERLSTSHRNVSAFHESANSSTRGLADKEIEACATKEDASSRKRIAREAVVTMIVDRASSGTDTDAQLSLLNSSDDSADSPSADELSSPDVAASSSPEPSDTSPLDSDLETFNIDRVKDFILSGGDAVMFKESKLKAWHVIVIILELCHRFSLSIRCRHALLEASKLFAGPAFKSWNISDYDLSKIFDAPDAVIKYHFYCVACYTELEEPTTKDLFTNHEAVCLKCSEQYSLSMNSANCFICLDLKYQITSLLKLPTIMEALMENLDNINARARSDDVIRDVYDGLLYKKLMNETDANTKLLTYVFNTDGAPLFKSSQRSFWPILLILNELPRDIRFKYPLLVGLCIVKKEPTPDLMNTYLASFVRQANHLCEEGFQMTVGERLVHFVLRPLACSVDSVARPLLQNRLQFNGYHGCSWCYAKGEYKHGSIRFLMEKDDPQDRTHEDHLKDCRAVTKKKQSMPNQKDRRLNVRGVKGQSILRQLRTFDMIWGFVRDYLHADLAGVVSQMVNMWADPGCRIRLTKAQFDQVNGRLMTMTPPQEVHRLVRPLKYEKAKWKASEWRSWLLFYAIPCLSGLLDDYALKHFALLVKSIYGLLQTNISTDDLMRIDHDLSVFLVVFELLYGEKYVTFNVHSLKHLVRCVSCCGPLWATSTFPFESVIHNLKQHVHGPKGVYEQISKKAMQRNIVQNLVEELSESPACVEFQKSLYGRHEVASFRRSKHGVVLIGNGSEYQDEDVINLIRCSEDNSNVLQFRRCVSSGMVVNSVAYHRQKKSDDTMFIDNQDRLVQVLYLLYCNNTAFAKVSCSKGRRVVIRSEPEACPIDSIVIEDVVVDHLIQIYQHDYRTDVIPVVNLREKCVFMKLGDETYVSRLPNTFEIQ